MKWKTLILLLAVVAFVQTIAAEQQDDNPAEPNKLTELTKDEAKDEAEDNAEVGEPDDEEADDEEANE